MKYISLSLLILVMIVPVMAQESCPILVEEALAAVENFCGTRTERNQLCYGNFSVFVEPDALSESFGEIGDVISIESVESIRTSPLSMPDEWGIAMMRVQANIPDTLPGQAVTFLLFGDAEIETAASPVTIVKATTMSNINVRRGPSTNTDVIMTLGANTPLELVGRNDAGDWVYFTTSESSGWVFASLVAIDGDVMVLEVVPDDYSPTPNYGPMQAVYFTSGIGAAGCVEAPHDGILIHSPNVGFPIELQINAVNIEIESTIYIQAQAAGDMSLYVLEGQAVVTAQDVRQVVPQGAFTTVPLDAKRRADGPPREPLPYSPERVETVPAQTIASDIIIAEPATTQAIEEANSAATIEGNWTGIDADGSHISLEIIDIGGDRYAVDYFDDDTTGAGCSDSGSLSGSGEGTLVNNVLAIEFSGSCTDGSNQWSGSVTFTYDPENDTVKENWTGTGISVLHTREK